jgi:leishmanolysin-like peptidase
MDVAYLAAERDAAGTGPVDDMVGADAGASEDWDGWNGATAGGGASGGSLGGNRDVVQHSTGVAMHEIGHVLGISSDSLQFFRHPRTGAPLTRRPFELSDDVTCVDGSTRAYVGLPGPDVMREGRNEVTGVRYYEVVTPTVRRVVRNHFDCPSMTGARLENQQDTTDCFGSHWDEMLYYTEIMGAVFSQSANVLSPLTLAYLEDSGWYRANYESPYVQISMFGHGAGCGFVDGNCIDTNTGEVPYEFEEMFCNQPTSISSAGVIDRDTSGSQTCDPSHTQKTYCDLVNTNELIAIGNQATALEAPPASFQYFEGRPELRPAVLTIADYCPVPHLSGESCLEYNGRGDVSSEMIDAGETYGAGSRCVDTDGSRDYSLCLATVCNAELGMVQINAGGVLRTCGYDGEVHEVLYDDDRGMLRIKCPKAALVCPDLFCPANCSGRGKCRFASSAEDDGAVVAADDGANAAAASSPLARCVCDSPDDVTAGCYRTPLSFPAEYGVMAENPNRANKTVVFIIVGSLIAGLAVMFVAVRQWKARQNVFM